MTVAPLRARSAYPVVRTLTTRWGDNDAYGHVNNTVYYEWFDTVVNAWLIESGLLDIEGGKLIGLVVETGCRYFRPLSYPQPVEIGLGIGHLGRSSVGYRLGVFAAGEDQPAAEGHFVHVYVGRSGRRPLQLPDRWRDRMAAIMIRGGEDDA